MAMQTVGESLLFSPRISWCDAFGSHPLATKSLVGESDSFLGVKVGSAETDQGVNKQSNSATSLAFSLGDVMSPQVVTKPHRSAFSMQSPCLQLGFTQPPVQYPYGVVSAYGCQNRVMLPLNLETEDGTIFVNSKQYHGIIRRRQSRAKAAAVLHHNKLTTRCRKPYMHHSRHLHALRRPRGSGGRFLNTKSQNKMEKSGTKADEAKQFQFQSQSQQSHSQNSEVLHPENVTMNLSNVSGSEVTSMNYFLGGMVMSRNWISATGVDNNGCCNFRT